jgi:hypothetical protein
VVTVTRCRHHARAQHGHHRLRVGRSPSRHHHVFSDSACRAAPPPVVDPACRQQARSGLHRLRKKPALARRYRSTRTTKGPVEKPLDGGVSTHRWACTPARGLTTSPPPCLDPLHRLDRFAAMLAHRPLVGALLAAQRKDEGSNEMVLGFFERRWFCSSGIVARPSDVNEWLQMNGVGMHPMWESKS